MTTELNGLHHDSTGYLFDADDNCIGKTYDKAHAKIIAEAFERDRNKPDVPALDRYSASGIMWGMDSPEGAKPSPNGEYVRHDQAAAMIAADKEEIISLREAWREANKQEERAEAAEAELASMKEVVSALEAESNMLREASAKTRAKLAQIKAQEPVGYIVVNEDGTLDQTAFNTSLGFEEGFHSLYFHAYPVSSDAQHEFEPNGPGVIGSDYCQVCGKEHEDHTAPLASEPTAKQALQIIADLPYGKNDDITSGHEDTYRAVEALFTTPPDIACSPPVASEAETVERLRAALQMIEAGHSCPSALARHALSGKEPS